MSKGPTMVRMARFTREPDRGVMDSLTRHLGRRPRILAWARTDDGVAVGLADRLVFGGQAQWREQLWHLVVRGSWDQPSGTLRWTRDDGAHEWVRLTEPGRLPELFNERVGASIVLQKAVDLPGGGSVLATLRRDLGTPDAPLIWRVQPRGRVRLDDPSVQQALTAELDRLRSEYDIS